MAKFVSKKDIVDALNRSCCLLANTRLEFDRQVDIDEKRTLCKLYSDSIDALYLDKGARFDLEQLDCNMLSLQDSVLDSIYSYIDKCDNIDTLRFELEKLYNTLKNVADLKPQEKAEAIVAMISNANLIKFGFFVALALALAIVAIIMTALGFAHIISAEISNGVAAVIGLIDLVLGMIFFLYERYTDMCKNSVKKQAKEYPAQFAKHYDGITGITTSVKEQAKESPVQCDDRYDNSNGITNIVINANVVGDNNKTLFSKLNNNVTYAAKLKSSAVVMKLVKEFPVNDNDEEEEA